MARSLERLSSDRIDTLIIHRPDVLTDPAETVGAFLELRAAGVVVLAWLLRLPWGIRPVVGTTRPNRIARAVAAEEATARMDADQWYRIWTTARGEPLP